MNSQTGKDGSSSIKVAVIGGLFVVLAACISGVFLLLNTMVENGNIGISPVAVQPENTATSVVMPQATAQLIQPTTVNITSETPLPTNISMLDITNKTSGILYSFKIGVVTHPDKNCPGAYLETGAAEITYEMNVPNSWVVIIDSWQAEWASGSYHNDGILIISGDWQGNIKINTGAICGVSAEQAQTALQYRRNVTGNDGRPEYTIP